MIQLVGCAQLHGMTCQSAQTEPMIIPAITTPKVFAKPFESINVQPNSSGIAPMKYSKIMRGISFTGKVNVSGRGMENNFIRKNETVTTTGIQKIANSPAHTGACLKSKMRANREDIPIPFRHAKRRASVNGTKIIRTLMGKPKGSPSTGATAPQI